MVPSSRQQHVARQGFTLLEVALAVTVMLIVTAGVFYGYQQQKRDAGGALAHRRLSSAQGTIEAYAAAHGNALPVSGQGHFVRAWAAAHPEERSVSPWGGPTGDPSLGASEDPPWTDGGDATSAPDVTGRAGIDPTRSGHLHYISIASNRYVRLTTARTGEGTTWHGYVLAIYDPDGRPWYDAVGLK